MARLEIPALYRLDIDAGTWGWHKMSDLVTAVDLLLERLPVEELSFPEIGTNPQAHIERLKGKRLLTQYGYLNDGPLMTWSDETDIGFYEIDKVPWERPNLFVPAKWGLAVVEAVKDSYLDSDLRTLVVKYGSCLTYRERLVISLRIGDGKVKGLSKTAVGLKMQTTRHRIRQIENNAIRKLRKAANAALKPRNLRH